MVSWYLIHIIEDNITIFEGYFVVNSNIIVGFYETINGSTNYNNNLLVTSNIKSTPPYPPEYLGFQLYRYNNLNNNTYFTFDNAYLSSWKQFDLYGVVIKSMSNKPQVTSYFNISASYNADESITNIGQIVWFNENTFAGFICSFTITPVPDPTQRRMTMGSLYTNNAQVYYKSHTLAPGGIGGVRNYRLKSRKT
jgi:hypothetical protein